MPNTEQQRECHELVQAIVKAVPEILEEAPGSCCIHTQCLDSCKSRIGKVQCYRPITLEDVLRALKESKREWIYAVDCYGNLLEYNPEEGWEVEVHEHKLFKWHLGHDLAWHRDNAPETITFLHSLLVP